VEGRAVVVSRKRRRRKRKTERTGPLEYYWPEGQDTPEPPTHYRVRRTYPCPSCKRVQTDHASQAVICEGLHHGLAYLRCRCCGHRYKLPQET